MSSSVRIAFLLACALAVAGPSRAQQTVDVGSVSGRVVDESGASIPGATVRATHHSTNIVASAVTDTQGRFRLPYLKIGVYDVAVSLSGFKDSARRLTVSAGSAFEMPVTLALAGIASNVTGILYPFIHFIQPGFTATICK